MTILSALFTGLLKARIIAHMHVGCIAINPTGDDVQITCYLSDSEGLVLNRVDSAVVTLPKKGISPEELAEAYSRGVREAILTAKDGTVQG